MDQFISHMDLRRECWKGHDSAEGVRRSIRYARSHSRDLTIYRAGTSGGYPAYHEVPQADWDDLFFPAATEGEA